jgi:putative membrane protein
MTEQKIKLIARIFLFIIYFVGLVGISIPSLQGMYVELTPFSLLISGLILLAFHEKWNLSFIIVIILIFLAGFAIEAYGVYSGEIFGQYSYSNVLGWKLFETPVIIGLNWLILIYCGYYIVSRFIHKPVFQISVGSLLLVAFDLLLEPVALETGMWSWAVGKPLFQNYLAWFVISVVLMSLFPLFKVKLSNPVAGYLFLFMVMFFGALNITL